MFFQLLFGEAFGVDKFRFVEVLKGKMALSCWHGLMVSRQQEAINVEQLDVLLESLKSYWEYSNQKSFLDEIKATPTKANKLKLCLLTSFNRGDLLIF